MKVLSIEIALLCNYISSLEPGNKSRLKACARLCDLCMDGSNDLDPENCYLRETNVTDEEIINWMKENESCHCSACFKETNICQACPCIQNGTCEGLN